MEQLTCCFDCVPINRPAVGRLFSYQLGGKNNLIVINHSPLARPICKIRKSAVQLKKNMLDQMQSSLRYWTLDFQNKELTHD